MSCPRTLSTIEKEDFQVIIDGTIAHWKETAKAWAAEAKAEATKLAKIAAKTAKEALNGDLTIDEAKENLDRLATAFKSKLIAMGFREQAKTAAWLQSMLTALLNILSNALNPLDSPQADA